MSTHRTLPERAEVVIIGAGLAGLAAAKVVHGAGREVVIVEASDDVGGRVRTDLVDGFRLDRGFQVLLTAYPEATTQLDLHALKLRRFEPGAVVWHDARFETVGDPFRRPASLVASIAARVGSPLDKLRVLKLRRRLLASDPRDLFREPDRPAYEALKAAGFSNEMVTRFFRPLFGGIQLDTHLGASSRMFEVLFRMLAIGDTVVPAHGMGQIARQLAAPLAGQVVLNTRVINISGNRITTADGRTIDAGKVIVATEGPTATTLAGVPAVASRSVTSVWFAAGRPPTASKMIMLNGSGSGQVLNAAVMSNVAPEYAVDGKALIVASCPGVCDPEIEPLVRQELRAWWGGAVDSWQHLRTDAIAHAQPDHVPPHPPKQRVHLGGDLFVCGDHRDTGSIQGALFSGRRCGTAVLASLAAGGSK
jgi:phytoene dehydrogenase-like protein